MEWPDHPDVITWAGVAHLLEPFTLRSVVLSDRIGVSPMCEYSSEDGFASDWHLVHLGSRAVGGAGVVLTEAAAVEPRGRITAADLGLWKDAHVEPLARIVRFLQAQGAVAGVQLAHAGRKASVDVPWRGGAGLGLDAGGWEPIAPSAIPFSDVSPAPRAMSVEDVREVIRSFAAAARRALAAGFQVLELHYAHGYLVHEFLSPLANHRQDAYGGGFDQRIRLALEIVRAVRAEWPERLPLLTRLSCTDWVEGGWTVDGSVELARRLASEGVDLVDCSSGGMVPNARVDAVPGYQVPFASRIRREAGVATAAVGLITTPAQAEGIVRDGDADLVFLAREMLRDPYWPLHAAVELGQPTARRVPVQYLRAF
ncbi:MAG TPA: NADH:flavin oxidoreductase/NADH oxidase [Myxococcaceae bacterium]|nr:NADH:flavin oxidoreductase/NADH oxidase [Myxococcaceae bacterium]